MPWVSFCISTYKRPDFLRQQLSYISNQSFKDFEVIISDNDPGKSARDVVSCFNHRFKYFPNNVNLGMIPSFNKSIERSTGEYILMVTDDDYITDKEKLKKFEQIYIRYPQHSIYINCDQPNKQKGEVEICTKEDFAYKLLNPSITRTFLWSDCILKSTTVKELKGIPDYGSPHLADHALLALCGREYGGVFINNTSSQMNSHEFNFSKSNLQLYYKACQGFHDLMVRSFSTTQLVKAENALISHLFNWACLCLFSLRGHFLKSKNRERIKELHEVVNNIFSISFMKKLKLRFRARLLIFNIINLRKNLKYYLNSRKAG